MFEVCFQYDEQLSKWDVIVKGAKNAHEALQGFSAVILTTREASPLIVCNKAELTEANTYRISIGR